MAVSQEFLTRGRSVDRAMVEQFAAKAIAWQFAPGGRDEGAVDCWGLVFQFARHAGIPIPDYRDNATHQGDGGNLFLENFHSHAHEIYRDAMEPGDIVLFRRAGELRHIGIYLGSGIFLHSDTGGVRRERLSSQPHVRRASVFLRLNP